MDSEWEQILRMISVHLHTLFARSARKANILWRDAMLWYRFSLPQSYQRSAPLPFALPLECNAHYIKNAKTTFFLTIFLLRETLYWNSLFAHIFVEGSLSQVAENK